MHSVLMTTLFSKALILQGEISCWSLLEQIEILIYRPYTFSIESEENLLKFQLDSSSLIMYSILMTTLFSKALILQGEISCWSLLEQIEILIYRPYTFSIESEENLLKFQLDSSSLIMYSILMTTLFSKALILQGEISCWSLLEQIEILIYRPYTFSIESEENLLKFQLDSSSLIMYSILMTTLFSKALILQGEISCGSLLGLKGLTMSQGSE